jgi:diaminopimelate epimerase
MRFTKMHGIGNDFVMLDAIRNTFDDASLPKLAIRMCDRRFGIGSDGLIIAREGTLAPLRMQMLNPDGSESEMCGNGIRCLAKFLVEEKLANGPEIKVETGAGVLTLQLTPDGRVTVDMGKARLTRASVAMNGPQDETFIGQPITVSETTLPGTAVSMGNPHLVFIVDDVDSIALEKLGPAYENHPDFPKRTNVHFVQILSASHIKQRTWERGAGITLACGTGACSAAVATHLNGKTERQVKVTLPGGELDIRYAEDQTVWMTGPAQTVFYGEWID